MILCAFALVVGSLTVHRIRSDFNREVAASASELAGSAADRSRPAQRQAQLVVEPNVDAYAAPEHAAIRVSSPPPGTVIAHTRHAPELDARRRSPATVEATIASATRRIARRSALSTGGYVVIQYARPLSRRAADDRARGAAARARHARRHRTRAARRRHDRAPRDAADRDAHLAPPPRSRARATPAPAMPQPEADDEVAELARTLQGMLRSLDDAHAETEAMLDRQRRFVADASHELRTPLTTVLANLELLAESLQRRRGRTRARSALRSSRRMRRLVADLLLLARSDVGRAVAARSPSTSRRSCSTPPPSSARSAPSTSSSLDVHPAIVEGDHDELLPRSAQPARERPAPHPARQLHPRLHRHRGCSTPCSSSRTTAPACPASSPPRCSSASCAAPGTAAGLSGWASRS